MELFQIDEQGQLFIGPNIDDWQPVRDQKITVVFDLDDDCDIGVPGLTEQSIYMYLFFPFDDKDLPDLEGLHELARLGARMIQSGNRVLCHCGMGHNRSALLAGLILNYLGVPGPQAVELIRLKRQGALYNRNFATYLENLPAPSMLSA